MPNEPIPMPLNTKERTVLAKAGEILSEHMANAGCNDTPDEWFADWSQEELVEFDRQYNEWNNSPDDHDPSTPMAHWNDNGVFDFLLAKALLPAPKPAPGQGAKAAAEEVGQMPLTGAGVEGMKIWSIVSTDEVALTIASHTIEPATHADAMAALKQADVFMRGMAALHPENMTTIARAQMDIVAAALVPARR